MLNTSWGQTAANNATALGVNPAALAATCVMESNCQSNPGGTGTISGTFQMSNSTYAQTVSEVSASNPDLASQITTKNDPASQSILASQYLLDGAQKSSIIGHLQPDRARRAQLLPVWPGLWRTGRQRVGQPTHGRCAQRHVIRHSQRERHRTHDDGGSMARDRHEQERYRRLATCSVGEWDMKMSLIALAVSWRFRTFEPRGTGARRASTRRLCLHESRISLTLRCAIRVRLVCRF